MRLPPPREATVSAHRLQLDRIYLEAVRVAEGDVREALLISSIATLPYRRFPAVLPLLGCSVNIPVSTETESDFIRRFERLPSLLFADTPPEGDRDKLPHIFGSAWLQCLLKHKPYIELIGRVVEAVESVFALAGFHDERDLRANRLGSLFGEALMKDPDALPSTIMQLHADEIGTEDERTNSGR
jgi:hypothetical protein